MSNKTLDHESEFLSAVENKAAIITTKFWSLILFKLKY